MAESSQAASSSSQNYPTLLSQLQALTQPSLALPPAFLHPYAPLPGNGGPAGWKGKGKEIPADSIQAQLEMVRAMRVSVEQAKTRLSQRDGDWGKLSRALKEVVTHQNILLPLSTSLNPAFLRPATYPQLPSARTALPPVQLLPALAQSQDIQTYHEDSQFGLLKSTLTLAGNCFVVDIDLETDAAAEEDEPGSAIQTPAPNSGASHSIAGSVRLSKIAFSYVTPGGGMEASEYVAGVLRAAVDAYLAEWNSVVDGLAEKGKRGKRLEECIMRVEGLLAEVKSLDGAVQVEGAEPGAEAGFAGLEAMAKRVEGLSGQQAIYPAPNPTICPSFTLLPPGPDSISNPIIRIRPAQLGEDVPIPLVVPEDIAGSSVSSPTPKWILEVIPNSSSNGIVVRRNWLGGPEGINNPWDGGIKVENLLYSPNTPTASQVNPFPYQSTFVHQPQAPKALEQHWSLPSPGPDGYVVGRIGLPESNEDLKRILECLVKQIRLNQMFLSVFSADHILDVIPGADGDAEDDEDMDDLLAEPTAIPITFSQSQNGFILETPFPHHEGPSTTLRSVVGLDSVKSEVIGEEADSRRRTAASAVEDLKGVNLVDIFRSVEGALKAARV